MLKQSLKFHTALGITTAILLFLATPFVGFAEGSKDLINNGGHRAYFLSTDIASVFNPYPTRGIVRVYVKAGETIYLGSSAQGLGGGTIIARTPNGQTYDSGSSTTIGRINNITEEMAGPLPNAGGYTPFTRLVGAAEGGIWEIQFESPDVISPAGANQPPKTVANAAWSQANNTAYISAFDVTVRDASNIFLTGRTYMNVFGGCLSTYDAQFYGDFKILTKDGYIYNVNNNGQAGYVFVFFVNNKGFKDGSGNAIYKSVNSSTNPPVQDPRAADTGTDITHKIFFNEPNPDMPTSANLPGGSSTWLLTPLVSPSVSNFLFTGTEGTLYKGGTYPLGGNITFTSSQISDYYLDLDINRNGSFADAIDVNLTGVAAVGNNTVFWDGLDGQGNPVAGNLSFSPSHMKLGLRGGEIHFPFMDVENNTNGIIITRTNGTGSPNDVVYWDDNVSGVGGTTNLTGVSSTTNGHKWGTTGYSSTGFGNEIGLDTWTYTESIPANPLMNVSLRTADLEVVSITPNNTTYCIGEEITYTVQIKNNGPDDVTGAKFALNYPSGFSFTSVSDAQTSGVSSISNNSSTTTQFTATTDLQNAAILTLTIKGKATAAGNLNNISASILRPADVTDPDATNPDSAIPTDANAECDAAPSGAGCNNIKTAASVTITSSVITILNAIETEGTNVVKNITFPVSIPAAANCNITVNYTVTHITTNAADFDASAQLTGTINIPAGATTANLQLLLNSEKVIEGNETFRVTLSSAVGGTLGTINVTGTINNDDTGGITVTKTDAGETGSSTGTFVFSFPSGVTSDMATEIDYVLAGTTLAGQDYTGSATGTIIIPAGSNSITLTLPITNDDIVEGDEFITIALTRLFNSHAGTVTNNSAVTPIITIADDDYGTLTLSNDVTITEGNNGAVTATFTLTLNKATGSAFTLNYATSDITAKTSDNDYTATGSVQLNFNGTVNESKNIAVTITGDTKIEAAELLSLFVNNLSDTFGGRLTIPVPSRTVTISNDDAGLITITKSNGEEGVSSGNFIFSYPPGLTTDVPITINYTLTGTATGGTDYLGAITGTLTLPAGQTTVSLPISVIDDTVVEGSETVQISATVSSNPYNISITNPQITLDILDNDNASLTISPATITEGDSGSQTLNFTVTLNNATATSFTVGYSTANGTATAADGDYIAPAGGSVVSFNGLAGESKTISISIPGDRKIEADETFNVQLTAPSNTFSNRLTLQSAFAAGTIVNNDLGAITLTATDGAETGSVSGTFKFSFPTGYSSDAPTILSYTIGGLASGNGVDYSSSAVNTITIPAGDNQATINLSVIDDAIVEGNETVTIGAITLNSIYSGVTLSPAIPVVNITDNDIATLILNGPVTVTEGNTGTVTASFEVTLDKATAAGFSINYATTNGSALSTDNDYVAAAGTITFTGAVGEVKIIDITVTSDTRIEPTENFNLTLSGLSNNFTNRLTVPVTTTTGIITNDDFAVIQITKSDAAEGSYNGSFTLSFPAGIVSDVATVINYTLSGTAIGAGTDYTGAITNTATIPAGQSSVTIPIPVIDDALVEDSETIILTTGTITSPYGVTVSNSPLSLNVLDNDNAILTLSDPIIVTEGNAGTTTATFNVTLSKATSNSFTIAYNTADVTATSANSDYVAQSGTLNFNGTAGEVRSVTITINGDTNIEADEVYNLILSGLSNNFNNRLMAPVTTATGRILNDDGGDITITTSNGEEGVSPGTFTFSFPTGVTSNQATDISYTLTGTSNLIQDYTNSHINGATSGTITIPANTNSVTLTLPVVDDQVVEGTETVFLNANIVSPITLILANTFKSIDILDNDVATLTLSGPVTLNEGNSGTTQATFNVTLSKATSGGFTVDYSSVDGTSKVADNDYIPVGSFLTFNGTAGETYPVTVLVNGDRNIEANETFTIKLDNLNNTFGSRLTIPVTTSTGNITNDDSETITITKIDGIEGARGVSYTFSFLSGFTSDQPISIDYNLAGTAIGAGIDFAGAAQGSVTLQPGNSSVVLNLPVIDDSTVEDSETIILTPGTVTSPYGLLISTAPVTATITDNDNATITVSPVVVTEGNVGSTTASFNVTLSNPTTRAFTINYNTANGSATTSDADYDAQTGTISFDGSAGTKTVNVLVKGDRLIESDENFSLFLTGLSDNFNNKVTIAAASATATITNDDTGVLQITSVNGSENGPNAGVFKFSFDNDVRSDKPTTISYTSNGTALAGRVDYDGVTSGSVTIPAYENNFTLQLPVIDDAIIEDSETISITTGTITSVYPISVLNSPQSLLITDNDEGTLTLSGPVTLLEGNTGTTEAQFTLTLNKATASPFAINYLVSDGTAMIADQDYISANGALNFSGLAGEARTIKVFINGDKKIEANELFNLVLGSLSNKFGNRLTVPVNTQTANITNDDSGVITITKRNGYEGIQDGSFVFSFGQGLVADIPVSINYTLSGTATGGGVDYTATNPGVIILPAGANSVTLNLPVADDPIVEDTETVDLAASLVSNAYDISLANPSETINILDNDDALLTISNASITEGHLGTQTLNFNVTLTKATRAGFTVGYTASNGSATSAEGDYVSTSSNAVLSFTGTAGEVQQVSIVINGDKKIEAHETFNVTLLTVSNSFNNRLTIPSPTAKGTILNDDSGVITITKIDGSENGNTPGKFTFSFPVDVKSDAPVTINYLLSGTAGGNGLDYNGSTSGFVILPAGENSVELSLPVIDDVIIEGDEAVNIAVTSINTLYASLVTLNAVVPTLTIEDNDYASLILSNSIQLPEGDSGTTPFVFTVTLDKGTSVPFTVNYATADGTAKVLGDDYISTGTVPLSFSGLAGETKTITVLVKGDFNLEGDEAFTLALSALSNSFGNRLSIQASPATGTIINDDNGAITVTKVDGIEGSQNVRFTFSFPQGVNSDAPTTIIYDLGGTATSADYTGTPINSITIPAGTNSATLILPVIDDNVVEEPESVAIQITGINNIYSTILWNVPLPVATIFDNDNATLTLTSPIAVIEKNTGTTTVKFTVTLDKLISTGFTIDYNTVNATATASDKDYNTKSGQLVFAGFAGETKEVQVVVNSDKKIEPDEIFNLFLDAINPSFAGRIRVLNNGGAGAILNDDVAPIALPDVATTPEDTPITFPITINDTDTDGIDAATVILTSTPAKGQIQKNNNGTVTYTPELNNFGTYQFTYTVKDIWGLISNETTVRINVLPVNDPPVAENDNFYVFKNTAYRGTVSSNDSDPDADLLKFKLLSTPVNGQLEFFNTTDGSFIYTPRDGYVGKDGFKYEVNDPLNLKDDADVTLNVQPIVTVNLTPVTGVITEGETIKVTAKLDDVLLQDVTVVLNYAGSAENTKDFNLTKNFQSITIPAGQKETTQEVSINSVKDYLREGDEVIDLSIGSVNPAPFVSIGNGSTITIKDFYPEDKDTDPNRNIDITPDPLSSPNGDGIGNEKFVINNIERYPDNEVIIFNRWGNEVYRIKGYNNKDKAFVGIANRGILTNTNATLDDGVYYFIIHTRVVNGGAKMNKGFVIIKR